MHLLLWLGTRIALVVKRLDRLMRRPRLDFPAQIGVGQNRAPIMPSKSTSSGRD
jgi:hypothetical protein